MWEITSVKTMGFSMVTSCWARSEGTRDWLAVKAEMVLLVTSVMGPVYLVDFVLSFSAS